MTFRLLFLGGSIREQETGFFCYFFSVFFFQFSLCFESWHGGRLLIPLFHVVTIIYKCYCYVSVSRNDMKLFSVILGNKLLTLNARSRSRTRVSIISISK